MTLEIILTIFGVGIGAVILGATMMNSTRYSSYLFANSRIAARRFLGYEQLSQLISAKNLPELVHSLRETDYYAYLDTINENSIKEFNIAIEKGLINSINEIKKISPKKFKNVFDVYVKIFESKIIKTFFRSRFSNVELDKSLIEPLGEINPLLLKHLHETKTIIDMKVVLRDTEYGELFEKEFTTIEEFDVAIEKKVMNDIDDTLEKTKIFDRKSVMDIFKKRREIKNILTLLKLRIRGKTIEEDIINIKGIDSKKLNGGGSLREFVEKFASTEYGKALQKSLSDFEESGNYYSFEKELLSEYYAFVRGNELSHTIGPYAIISYITKKEIEHKNLLIIAKGIISGIDKEEIKRMIIT